MFQLCKNKTKKNELYNQKIRLILNVVRCVKCLIFTSIWVQVHKIIKNFYATKSIMTKKCENQGHSNILETEYSQK